MPHQPSASPAPPIHALQRGGMHDRAFVAWAIAQLADPAVKPVNPPLLHVPVPELPGVDLYVKDEASHPSGSLKHRLAHALFLHALCNGAIGRDTTIIEASSGSTAISEAWFAQKLGLRFIAVVPECTAPAKLEAIAQLGGAVEITRAEDDPSARAAELAAETGGLFMDQFTNAAEVTDWRGANNIADTLFAQMRAEPQAIPSWVVLGAGTGGTSTTIGRYIRLRSELCATRLCVVDPEGSALFEAYATGDRTAVGRTSAAVEGIGRPRVEPGFNPALIDHMMAIADAGSVAGAHWLERRTGRAFGPSTGTAIIGALLLGQTMARTGERGSIVLLGCDDGARYQRTIYAARWLTKMGIDIDPWRNLLKLLGTDRFPQMLGA